MTCIQWVLRCPHLVFHLSLWWGERLVSSTQHSIRRSTQGGAPGVRENSRTLQHCQLFNSILHKRNRFTSRYNNCLICIMWNGNPWQQQTKQEGELRVDGGFCEYSLVTDSFLHLFTYEHMHVSRHQSFRKICDRKTWSGKNTMSCLIFSPMVWGWHYSISAAKQWHCVQISQER